MASTTFQDYNQNTPITSAWLNDINKAAYTPAGTAKTAVQSAAAWVRFAVAGGVVTIQQSSNIGTVTRTGVGVYVVTFTTPMTGATNSYGTSMSQAGFVYPSAESASSVTVTTLQPDSTAVDPTFVCVQVFGAD